MNRPNTAEYHILKDILLDEYKKMGTMESIVMKDRSKLIPGTDIELGLRFYNPDIKKHTHPDHKKNQVGVTFGNKSEQEWRELFAQSFDILKKVSPGFMHEIE